MRTNDNMARTASRDRLLHTYSLIRTLTARAARPGSFEALGAAPSELITGSTYAPSPLDIRPFGIDVSRFNLVDWVTVSRWAAPRVRYAMVRLGQAHQGAYDDIDRRVFYNWHNARAVLPGTITLENGTVIDAVMAYHVLYPGSPIIPQVNNVVRIVRLLGGIKHGPLWIDMELQQGQTGAKIIAAAGEFIWRLQQALGILIGDYTGKWVIDKYKLPPQPWWAEIPWWLAQYGSKGEATIPLAIPAGIPLAQVLFHQTSSAMEGMLFGAPLGSRADSNRLLVGIAA